MKSIGTLIVLASLAGSALAQAPSRPAKVGDVHVYSTEQRADRLRYDETVTVSAVSNGRIETRHVRSDRPTPADGLYDAEWATIRSGTSGSQLEPPLKVLQQPLEVGRSWEATTELTTSNGAKSRLKLASTIAAREKVSTPAGEFDAFRVDSKGYISGLSWQGGFGMQQRIWYAPAINRVVRSEYREQRSLGADNVTELKLFKPAD
jgi:hypothetical protein